jgi:hypothetical protein
MTDTTIHNLIAEYLRRAEAIISRGERPPVPELMKQVLVAHPEIAVDFYNFARMCAAAMRREAERDYEEADQLQRYHESRNEPGRPR